MKTLKMIGGVLVLVSAIHANAALSNISVFQGNTSEDFESFTPETFQMRVLDGTATLSEGQLYDSRSLNFWNVNTGGNAVGIENYEQGTFREVSIVFDNPVTDFGSFWGARQTGSLPPEQRFSLLFFSLFDINNNVLGNDAFEWQFGSLEWRGWHAAEGISRIEFFAPFPVLDNLQANSFQAIPEPSTWVLSFVGAGAMLFARLRRRSS